MGPAILAAAALKHQQLQERMATGKKWCAWHGEFHVIEDFPICRSAPDGRGGWCLAANAADARARWARRKAEAVEMAAEQARREEAARALAEWRRCEHCCQMRDPGSFVGVKGQPVKNCALCRQRQFDSRKYSKAHGGARMPRSERRGDYEDDPLPAGALAVIRAAIYRPPGRVVDLGSWWCCTPTAGQHDPSCPVRARSHA